MPVKYDFLSLLSLTNGPNETELNINVSLFQLDYQYSVNCKIYFLHLYAYTTTTKLHALHGRGYGGSLGREAKRWAQPSAPMQNFVMFIPMGI